VILWFALVATLLVVAAVPASATAVASINTTAQDFQSASLDDMEIVGSGASASVTGEVGTQETVSFGLEDFQTSVTAEHGVEFEVSDSRGTIWGDIGGSGVSTAYLRYGNGTLIESKPVSPSTTVRFNHTFLAGETYQLTADDGGDGFSARAYSASLPTSSGGVTVTSGVGFGSPAVFTEIRTGSARVEYVGDEHTADANTLFADVETGGPTTVRAQANDGTGWSDVATTSITSDQNVSLDISGSSATRYRTVVESSEDTSLWTVTVNDEGVLFDESPPSLSNPEPADGSEASSYDGEISVNVSDPDFATAQGDLVTVVATEDGGGQIGSQQLNAPGTVTFDYAGLSGSNNITWTATDSYGRSATPLDQDFATASQLVLRNESNTSELVGSPVTVELQFVGDDQVFTLTTDDGVVSTGGLPAGESFIVEVQPGSEYEARTVVIPDITQQNTVYLLPTNATSNEIEYVLEDNSGVYPAENTTLYVSKPINVSGGTEFKRIASDDFSASGSAVFTLAEGDRYRLRVQNGQGDQRVLGAYTATGDALEPLRIRGVGIAPPDSQGYAARVEVDDSGAQRNVTFRYLDEGRTTDELHVEIYERGNESNTVFEDDVYASEIQNYSAYATLQNDTSYEVNWSAQRGGETIGATRPIGGVDLGVDLPLDPQWAGTIGFVMMGFLAALGGRAYGTQIAVVLVAIAGVLMGLRVIDIFPPLWWAALVIALGLHVAKKQLPGGI
jgi:hypothetical protein